MAMWYICDHFGIFLPVLVFCSKKNLATLHPALPDNAESGTIRNICLGFTCDYGKNWQQKSQRLFKK
jgi:hypothetical protein